MQYCFSSHTQSNVANLTYCILTWLFYKVTHVIVNMNYKINDFIITTGWKGCRIKGMLSILLCSSTVVMHLFECYRIRWKNIKPNAFCKQMIFIHRTLTSRTWSSTRTFLSSSVYISMRLTWLKSASSATRLVLVLMTWLMP